MDLVSSAAAHAYLDEITDRGLIGRFEHICARFPDRVAVDDGTTRLTYRELRARAYALADAVAREAPAGRPVAAVIPGSAVYPVALLACLVPAYRASRLDPASVLRD